MTLREVLGRSDPVLLGSAFLLSALSLVLLWTGPDGGFSGSFFLRQSVFLSLALVVCGFVARVHYSLARSLAGGAYGVLLLLLVLLVFYGRVVRGAASWFSLGIVHLQPGEIAKVILVVVLAKVLSERQEGRFRTRSLLFTMITMGIPIAFILAQPDFGTAALLVFLWAGMVIVAGLTRRHALALSAAAVLGAILGWSFLLQDYQRERMRVFLNPQRDPLGSGYTILQSVTAFGSGGLFGRGLGYGPQSRLKFLPEHHTDFIFARVGEELGLVGVAGMLVLYSIILRRILRAAERTSDPFGRALAVGTFLTFLIGMMVNAGMNVGLLPVTGVPLPLVSYGGSSLLTMYLLLGLVESVIIHGETWETGEDRDPSMGMAFLGP